MAIRFRYRSSPHFETIDLAGAGSASVRNLRARILGPAPRCHFDLLISYAASNHILDDDALLIPAGSDLVIKRVPIEFVDGRGDSSAPPQDKAEEQHGCGRSDRGDDIASFPPPLHNFDDTDKALCPGLEAESYADVAKVAQSSEKRYLNIEGSGLSEAMPEEIVMDNSSEELGLEEGKRETKTSFKAMEPIKMEQSVAKSSQVVTNIDSPAELRCFLCKSIFEDAVMIPCCQHSFCSKCIVFALVELNKCPKCSSTRCTANDLLPNLSLRKAIKHFLDDLGPVYARDVESCVEEKESSCPLSIHQQEQNLLCSPSAIGKDSNQLMPIVKVIEKSSSIKICLDGNKPTETAPTLPREAPRNSDFQGSASSSKVYQNIAQDSGDLRTIEAKALRINSWDADGRGFATPAIRARKGGRTCYRCGSPNHLIRYCPVASNVKSEDSALHGDAYGPPNWQGSMFHPLQPYGNMYGTPEIISFDPGDVPVSPFGVPSYMPSFSGGMQNPYAFMGMRSMPSPMLPGVQQPLSHTGLGIHDNVKSQNAPSERGVRENDYDSNSADYHGGDGRRTSQERYQPEKSYERGYHESNTTIQKRHHKDKYCSPAHENLCYSSDDELVDQKHRKELGSYGREMRSHYTKQSASEVHDIPNISIPDTRQRNKQHDRSASGKRDEIRAKSKSEYTENTRHQSHKENIRMDRSDDGHKSSKSTYGHKHRVQETYYATDYKHDSKIKRSSQSSRHDKTKVGSSVGHVGRDRWAMEDGRPDDYERRDHYRHKTKRRH